MKKISILYLPLYIILFLLINCKDTGNKQKNDFRTITDMGGREIEIPINIKSAFIDRHSVMLVYAFDSLLPVNRVFNYNKSEKKYLKKGFYENKPLVIDESVEEIIKLNPDIVLFSKPITSENIEKANLLQEKTKKPVILLDNDFFKYKETLSFLGTLLHKNEKSTELIDFIKTYVDSIPIKVGQIPIENRKKIYYAEGYKGLQTDPSGSVHSLLINLTGGVNVATVDLLPGKGMTGVSLEQIYTWNPDIILVWSGNYDSLDSYKHILNDPLWAKLNAVKSHAVYQVPWEPFGWIDRPPGINRLMGSIWLSNLLYPEIFKQDVNSIAKEYFSSFYYYKMSDEEVARLTNPKPLLTR